MARFIATPSRAPPKQLETGLIVPDTTLVTPARSCAEQISILSPATSTPFLPARPDICWYTI